MQIQRSSFRAFAFAAGVALLAVSGWVNADPPSRVARLGYATGAVSFSPAGENDWVQATINRPLTTGDRLWVDNGARAELQVGGAMIRMNAGTSVAVLNLDDRIAQLQVTQGALNVRVRRLDPEQVIEIDTPNLAFTVRQPGEYRIVVDADGSATDIVVRKGQGEVYGEGASYVVDSRQPYRFTGTGLREYQQVAAPQFDDFDRWSSDRDRSYDNSPSARYVSQDVIGYQDLDANGTWRADPTYGNVWVPTRVAAGWAPFRDGHWAWVDPWGWTWVDDAPWGFAVSHYGRWTNMRGTWGWVPGPVRTRAYYAPAVVAFVGGNNFQLTISSGNVGGIAWFPLGPREVYRPSYRVSRGYFENINRSNTVVNTTVINNYYNNTNVTNVTYVNRQVPGAIVAVPTTAFVQSQPVGRSAVRVTREQVASAPVAAVAAVAPTEKSVRGSSAQGDKPPARVFERPVVARTAPPPASVGFAAQQQELQAKPGTPVDDTARRGMKSAAAAPAPVVNVVAQPKAAPPTTLPPPTASTGKAADGRGKSDERRAPPGAAMSGAPGAPAAPGATRQTPPVAAPAPAVAPPQVAAPAQAVPPAQVAPPAVVAQPPEQRGKGNERGKGEERGKGDQRGMPAASAPAMSPPAATPPAASPPAAPPRTASPPVAPQAATPAPPPMAQPQSPSRPPMTPQRVTPPQGAAPPSATPAPAAIPSAPPAPAAVPPEQRGRSEQRGRAEPKAVSPQVAPPQAAPPQVAPQAPAAQPPRPPVRPEPVPAVKQADPRPPVAAPGPPAARTPPAPAADDARRGGGRQDDKKNADDKKREEEERKQKG